MTSTSSSALPTSAASNWLTLLNSAEYRGGQVKIYYGTSLLGRNVPPSAAEVSSWVNSGLDLTTIRVDFLASPEFFFRVTGLQP